MERPVNALVFRSISTPSLTQQSYEFWSFDDSLVIKHWGKRNSGGKRFECLYEITLYDMALSNSWSDSQQVIHQARYASDSLWLACGGGLVRLPVSNKTTKSEPTDSQTPQRSPLCQPNDTSTHEVNAELEALQQLEEVEQQVIAKTDLSSLALCPSPPSVRGRARGRPRGRGTGRGHGGKRKPLPKSLNPKSPSKHPLPSAVHAKVACTQPPPAQKQRSRRRSQSTNSPSAHTADAPRVRSVTVGAAKSTAVSTISTIFASRCLENSSSVGCLAIVGTKHPPGVQLWVSNGCDVSIWNTNVCLLLRSWNEFFFAIGGIFVG